MHILKIGIDVGGSKIKGVLLSDNGVELNQKRIKTPEGGYRSIIQSIDFVVNSLTKNHYTSKCLPVGIGMPGSLSQITGLVKNANTTCLINKAFDKDLQNFLNRPIKLANDADCFTISEATDGAGKDYSVVFGVILGTGVGGGLTFNGELWVGPNTISGEWGHNPLPWSQGREEANRYEMTPKQCYCGKMGCIETFLSGQGLSNDYTLFSSQLLSPKEIVRASQEGDLKASEAISRYEIRLAKALSSVINILDPDVIILGGGLSNIDRLYKNVPKLWTNWVFSDTCVTKLVKNIHGDDSGVRGAAWLW